MNKLLLLLFFLFIFSLEAFSQDSALAAHRPADKATMAAVRKPGYKARGGWNPHTTPITINCCSDSTRFEYDAQGNETSLTFYVLEVGTTTFYPLTRDVNTYDRNNRIVLKTTWGWNGHEKKLTETGRIHFTYGTGGVADSVLVTRKDAATGQFMNGSLQTNKYNDKGEAIEWLFHSWENQKWKPQFGEKYIRSGSTNGVYHEELYQVYRNTGWSDASKRVNTFTDGRVTEHISHFLFSGVWKPMSRQYNYVYRGANAPEHLDVSYTRQVWSNEAWKDAYRHSSYTYPDQSKRYLEEAMLAAGWSTQTDRLQRFNEAGQLISMVTDEISFHWVKKRTQQYVYDAEGTLLEEFFYLEDNMQADMSEYGRYGDFKTFALVTGIPEEKTPLATVYPNPTQQLVWVEPFAATPQLFFIEVMNMTGKLLLQQEHRSGEKALVDLAAYPSGLYFVRLTQGDKVQTHKVVKRP